MDNRDVALVDERRAAWGSIRGYLYQAGLSALRWLELNHDEYLICEGDEDIDRRIREGAGESEQVKHRARRFDRRDLRRVLAGFLRTYVALQRVGEKRTFRLTTNVPRSAWDVGGLDLLAAWTNPTERDEYVPNIADGLRDLLSDVEGLGDAIAWMEAPGGDDRWAAFVRVVEWSFDAPDLYEIRGRIARSLVPHVDVTTVDAAQLTDRLIGAVLDASVESDPRNRVLDRTDLSALLAQTEKELQEWAESPPVERVRAALAMSRVLYPMIRDRGDSLEPSVLLRAEYQLVGFREEGREAELSHLAEWCDDPAPLKIELWTGDGGSGKTRLMIEWCKRLRESGWHAGFLREFTDEDLDLVLERGAPRLVVLDYPETRVDQVKRVLRRLGAYGVRNRLRLVLLARHAGAWWNNLPGPGEPDIKHLFTVVAPPSTRQIEPLASETAQRHRLFEQSVADFAEALEASPDAAPPVGLDTDPRFERALYVQMAALLGVVHGATPTGDDLLHDVLDHERSFWVRGLLQRGRTADEIELVDKAVTLLTLAGGAWSSSDAKSLIQWALPGESNEMYRAVYNILADVYVVRSTAYVFTGLQPDLLGEQLVIEVLAGDEDLAATVSQHLDLEQQAMALTVVTRIAGRHAQGQRIQAKLLRDWSKRLGEVADPLGPALAEALVTSRDHELAAAVSSACDAQGVSLPVPLLELAASALQVLLEVTTDVQAQARILNGLGLRLRELGRHDEALLAAQESVERYVTLAENQEEAYLSRLAGALVNLGTTLSAIGRREDALAATEEAVSQFRDLADISSGAYLPSLALSLSNLGPMLSELGRHEDALVIIKEAVEHFSTLAATRPETHLPDLAMSKINLGRLLSTLGRQEEALLVTGETVSHYRALVDQRPDTFRPDLALSLNNQATMLSMLGRHELALVAIGEATAIRRGLANARPDAFLPDLAQSLLNQGITLIELGGLEEALVVTQESIEHYHVLADRSPDAYLPGLALSVNNLGVVLSGLGHREDALAANDMATEIRRALADANPDAFLPDLAMSLLNAGKTLRDVGDHENALATTQEAVDHYRALAGARPDSYLPELAKGLNNLGTMLSDLDRYDDALDAAQETVAIRRKLADAWPDAYLRELASSLSNLGAALQDVGRLEEGLVITQEAIDHFRIMADGLSQSCLPDLATGLSNLGTMLSELNRHEEALAATQEAVDHYRKLVDVRPDAFLPNLALCLGVHSMSLAGLGRFEEAMTAAGEGAAWIAPALQHYPETFADLAYSLCAQHIRFAEAADKEPDLDLLEGIAETLSTLEEGD